MDIDEPAYVTLIWEGDDEEGDWALHTTLSKVELAACLSHTLYRLAVGDLFEFTDEDVDGG